jgi:hypothetical protein
LGIDAGDVESAEDPNQQSYCELDDWKMATLTVASNGRVPKHAFDDALARLPSYIVSLTLRRVFDDQIQL